MCNHCQELGLIMLDAARPLLVGVCGKCEAGRDMKEYFSARYSIIGKDKVVGRKYKPKLRRKAK
jgi:hypothetical protein